MNFTILLGLDNIGVFNRSMRLTKQTFAYGTSWMGMYALNIMDMALKIAITDNAFENYNWYYQQPGNENLILFHEYFHGDTGRGLWASHQTGWTALVTDL
jgi:hypothetical protein